MISFKQFDEPYKLCDFVNHSSVKVISITSHYAKHMIVWTVFYEPLKRTKAIIPEKLIEEYKRGLVTIDNTNEEY